MLRKTAAARGAVGSIGAILWVTGLDVAQATTPPAAPLPVATLECDHASLEVDVDPLLRSPSAWNGKAVTVSGIALPAEAPGFLRLRSGRDSPADPGRSIRLSFDYGPYAASEAELRKAMELQGKLVVVRGVFVAIDDADGGGGEIRFICSIESWPALED